MFKIYTVNCERGPLRCTQACATYTHVRYFAAACGRPVDSGEQRELQARVLQAYRWQYILSGHPRFLKVLTRLITPGQAARVMGALAWLQ